MKAKKILFTSFLEFANGALPDAFSAQVLGTVPNEYEEDNHDPDKLLKKKLETMMGTTQKDPDASQDSDDRLFSILTSFLTHAGEEDNIASAHDDPTDAPHASNAADDKYEDGKHNQLLAAINDLRDELKTMKTGESQSQSKWKVSRISTEENEESYEENEENTKQARARQMFTGLINQGMPRQDIINQFIKQIGVTNSTATSYYQRLAKEAGLTTSGDRDMSKQKEPHGLGIATGNQSNDVVIPQDQNQTQLQDQGIPATQPESNINGFEVQDDPNRQGLVRTVKGAHLVYKRKNEEGSYDELWVFGTGNNDIKDSLEVRRAILAGTDIPPRALKSENGQQSYTLTSLGNGQLLHIKGQQN